jgi:hypothetical protein
LDIRGKKSQRLDIGERIGVTVDMKPENVWIVIRIKSGRTDLLQNRKRNDIQDG